jgi:hypothetical protein
VSRRKKGQLPEHVEKRARALLAARDADDIRRLEEEALKSVGRRDTKPAKSSQRGGPSKVERDYARHLDALVAAREVVTYLPQPEAIELAHRCTYRTDYEVVRRVHDMPVVEWHEVKGRKGSRPYYRDDGARVKAKVAARLLAERGVPLFVVWPKKGGGWCQEQVKP